jgi:hypothetical protein
MPSTFVAFMIASAPISTARSAPAVSVVKNGLPVPAAKMTTRPFLQVADRPPANVRLGDRPHLDRGEHPRVHARALERVLHRERVHDGREHAHVVGGPAVHALLARRHAAEDVPRRR